MWISTNAFRRSGYQGLKTKILRNNETLKQNEANLNGWCVHRCSLLMEAERDPGDKGGTIPVPGQKGERSLSPGLCTRNR
jgi:hypothetical protein